MTHPVDEAFSGFLQLMARLWRARWFVIGIAALFAILTFINLKFIALETFRSEAILYLAEEVEPPILDTLLKNPEMLDVVRKRFLERFPDAKGVAQMEKFKRRFQMDQVILEDNSLRKRYSPALTLSADAHSAEEAQALASIWLEEVTSRFGGASGLEAQFKVQHARQLLNDLKSKESQSVERQVTLRVQARDFEKRINALLRMLDPAEVASDRSDREFRPFFSELFTNSPQFSVSVPTVEVAREPGLIARHMQLETELARARAELKVCESLGGESMKEKADGLRIEMAGKEAQRESIASMIAQTHDEVTSLSTALETVKAELAAVDAEVAALRLQQEITGSTLAENLPKGYLSTQEGVEGRDLPARMDFTVVASPSLPDRKIAPKRVVGAITAGFIGGLLACFVVALAHLVEQLPEIRKKKA